MHTWLPDAHSQAPSPVCALLSGVETTSVLYVILRLFPVMQAASLPQPELGAGFGLVSVGIAAFLLLQVRDYKRLFAFSTVEHMGIILAAVGLAQPRRLTARCADRQSLADQVVLLLRRRQRVAGAGTREIAAVRGLIRSSPVAGAALIFGGLAIAGAPPLAVFLSEFAIFRAGLAEGRLAVVALLLLFIAIGSSA